MGKEPSWGDLNIRKTELYVKEANSTDLPSLLLTGEAGEAEKYLKCDRLQKKIRSRECVIIFYLKMGEKPTWVVREGVPLILLGKTTFSANCIRFEKIKPEVKDEVF